MTIKRIIFRGVVRILEFFTLIRKPSVLSDICLEPVSRGSLDLVTIAYNNPNLIKYQDAFLKKFILDHFTRIVVDNSTDKKSRDELFQYCKENHIPYVGIPHNYLNMIGSSYSHAAAVNYIYRHAISKRRPDAFGLIDHDLFPIRPISLMDKLISQPIYGPLRHRGKCWYLSAIMTFFKYDFIKDKKIDFMPVKPDDYYLDSGGGNWYDIYSRLELSQLVFPDESVEPFREGSNRHNDCLEYFDDKLWIHTINGSCWKEIEDNGGKQLMVKEILDSYLK